MANHSSIIAWRILWTEESEEPWDCKELEASFTAYDFDDNDPLTYKLIDILKKYTCDFYFKKEANSPENPE